MRNFRPILIAMHFLVLAGAAGCDKQSTGCENPSMKGRIIGYNPCLYFSADNDHQSAGVVIEVDQGNRKDTVVTYSLSREAVTFPQVNSADAIAGVYLYNQVDQDQLKVEFELRESQSRVLIVCPSTANMTGYGRAVKDNEVVISCLRRMQ